jgi:hypothetical protein
MTSFLSEVAFLPGFIQGEMNFDLEKVRTYLHLAGLRLEYLFLTISGDLPNMLP